MIQKTETCQSNEEEVDQFIWHPTPVLLPGKSQGQRSLVGCSPWGRKESDTTKRLHFHFSLSCIGERNGNPLQCSCLENPRDGGAWWAAVYRIAQSRTRLKRLSSSSSRLVYKWGSWPQLGAKFTHLLQKGQSARMQIQSLWKFPSGCLTNQEAICWRSARGLRKEENVSAIVQECGRVK